MSGLSGLVLASFATLLSAVPARDRGPETRNTAFGDPSPAPVVRHVRPGETWAIRNGRFYCNAEWVFLKTGKLIRAFEEPSTADAVIADLDVLIDRLQYNNFSFNIYPDCFDGDADGRIDRARTQAYANIGRILDHCWARGVFCCLSFETYNIGGGGTPAALFKQHPDVVALNALGEPATDVEYGGQNGKPVPSIFHPAYLRWSREFLRHFLEGLGRERTERLLYVEPTVEPQYLGRCSIGNRDDRRAFLDFSEAAREAFEQWRASLPADDPHRALQWPVTQAQRDALLGNALFNDYRGQALGAWVSGDAAAIRAAAPQVWIAVDYNGRFDDPKDLRVGDHDAFLNALVGVNIIQIAPHALDPWGPSSWDDVIRVNRRADKHWAISEHMTIAGDWQKDERQATAILENTLARGTRWGWEFVNVGNQRASDPFQMYNADWTSPALHIIEGKHWGEWLRKIGAEPFKPVPRPRASPPDSEPG